MNTKTNLFLSALLAAPIAAFAGVTQTDALITLDGKFDEAVWQKAEWNGDFQVPSSRPSVRETGSRKPVTETFFAMVADDQNLYVGIKAHHDKMDEMKGLRLGGQWATEACEIFLVPTGGDFEYYQFLVCYPGLKWAMFYSEHGGIKPDPYGPVWDRAIADMPDGKGWTAEVKIPLSSLYMTRNTNWVKDWRINISRTYKTAKNSTGANSCWADVPHNYGEVRHFRDYGNFPIRRVEDDAFIRSATADIKGLSKDGKPVGTLKVPVYVAKGGKFVFTTPYAESLEVTLKDGDNEIDVEAVFPENGRHTMRLALKRVSDGSVCERDFPLRVDYQAIRVKLTTPQYRNNFYPGQNADKVRGTVHAVASDPVTLTLEGPGFAKQTVTMTRPGEFAFDTTGFEYGDATLTATCGKDTLVKKIRRLKPLPEGEHASWIENGNLVIDGRPTVMRNIYAEGFMGGRAFDKKYKADKESGRLHETTHIKQISSTDPTWIARELKYTECMKDQMPSKTMFDALDKSMTKQHNGGSYYYGVDEPECHGISAVYLEHCLDYVAEKDPYHVIVCCCRSGETYGNTADVFAPHPYINPEVHPDGRRTYARDFNQLGHFVDAFHPEQHPDKCIGGAPTCFAYPQGDYPTFKEYVLNYWCEFVRGAKTMYPYAYHDMGDRPALYEGTRYMFESMKALEDVILFGTRRTLVKTREYECCLWTLPEGDRMFAFVNFTQKPQKVAVEGLYGCYREFRGTRTFANPSEIELEPLEALVACEKPRDAGLETLAEATKKIDALEYVRTHRDNQLAGRRLTMDVVTSTGKKGAWRDDVIKVVDGVYDVIAWADPSCEPSFFEMGFRDKPVTFRELRIYGRNIAGFAAKVPDGSGWRTLEPANMRTVGDLIAVTFGETITPSRLRIDFPKGKAEVYEIELPKAVSK